ncbi:hypothetical protein [Rheinheimera mangrovi]|uniref:hypothetical protein n=1 Tax=Rheinheimera mangrovi TaxID=2498451 RepID=UPI0013DFEB81|nr:hypothetical protein [Rheinheimera mangrovi]
MDDKQQFLEHLNKSTQAVLSWPSWKKEIFLNLREGHAQEYTKPKTESNSQVELKPA